MVIDRQTKEISILLYIHTLFKVKSEGKSSFCVRNIFQFIEKDRKSKYTYIIQLKYVINVKLVFVTEILYISFHKIDILLYTLSCDKKSNDMCDFKAFNT